MKYKITYERWLNNHDGTVRFVKENAGSSTGTTIDMVLHILRLVRYRPAWRKDKLKLVRQSKGVWVEMEPHHEYGGVMVIFRTIRIEAIHE